MAKLLKSALNITELAHTMRNIATDDKRELESYTDAEIVAEAKYCLSCFNEGGHQSNDELTGEHGPEAQREAKQQVSALKRLIAKAT